MPDRPLENDPKQPAEGIFEDADLVFSYTRAQAIEDGVLVDVSEMAKEAGFVVPVAVTEGLWADIQAIPEDQSHQDVQGRLWDVLMVGKAAIQQCHAPWEEILLYDLVMHTEGTSEYTVQMVFGPGDDGKPVLTFMRHNED